ncbi:MAG: energy transducer TonB, partial [Verrucomicrobiota bacterium]
PPPPPPPPPPENPPPPQRMELPKLAPLLDPSAPAIKARLTSDIDLTMEMSDFALEITAPKKVAPPAAKPAQSYKPAPRPKPSPQRTTYSSGELDSRPRLRYAPTASFPAQLRKQGVTQGHATVEVLISASGNVSVRRVLSSSHPEFSSLARSVASRSRFTAPTKNGRPVKAIYRWPLVFRP